ncbi:4-(cytidine 5'-diphospho)-2-C-methyl-D-erythritol kinase [Parafrankia sp. BMG5.11]|uniref:4-(cytidine 5'-diphospho)-2-C-methyl-D-erythritol kinase n=1 Tax=Parafrankia sp. BMG5.11 TaxID=222540 RepID=UPI00103E4C7A|nr:4-(cytidine 5'-diphospho)-2-C-methyl-D-erythritol kinase [Parafrankia sp. BMG5.11]TCJ37430.1 4-(cytidine 5'-diphospho)-2-C-methyl-D-erythritol kinase [Parafrankia sp. BMG5.11]
MREIAYAKINLALHVRRRRDDGYHELETLFAFVDAGDLLVARPSDRDELTVSGEFAPQLTDPFGNLVTAALGKLPRAGGLSLALEKNLPVAAGLGGGSADAGAVFRIVDALHGLPGDWLRRAASLGADVPACVASRMCLGYGSGIDLAPIINDLEGAPVILVNPRAPLATGAVFAGWSGEDRGPLPVGPASIVTQQGRNDLEDSAVALVPEIAGVLSALRRTGASVARMSGSGATCFALYSDAAAQAAAAAQLSGEHPGWWIMEGKLRP